MTIRARVDYSPRMALSRLGMSCCVLGAFLAAACTEQAMCVDGTGITEGSVVIQCSTGKVAVCGTNPDLLYNPRTGALLPVPEEPTGIHSDPAVRAAFNGQCPDGVEEVCGSVPGADGTLCMGQPDGTPCGEEGNRCERGSAAAAGPAADPDPSVRAPRATPRPARTARTRCA